MRDKKWSQRPKFWICCRLINLEILNIVVQAVGLVEVELCSDKVGADHAFSFSCTQINFPTLAPNSSTSGHPTTSTTIPRISKFIILQHFQNLGLCNHFLSLILRLFEKVSFSASVCYALLPFSRPKVDPWWQPFRWSKRGLLVQKIVITNSQIDLSG